MGNEVSFRGKLYSSKTALAEAFGISVRRLTTRINMGWSMEEALGLLKRQRPTCLGIEIRFRKKLYPSKSALAVTFGISPRLLDSRLRKGWSLEEALGVVERQSPIHQGSPVAYRGTRYPSITAFALAFDQKPGTVFARIQTGKWSLAQSIGDEEAPVSQTKGRRRQTTLLTRKGKKVFGTFQEAAEWCGVDRRVAHSRMRLGWTLEQALDQEDPPEQTYAGYGTVYLISNLVNGRGYVGQTMQRLQKRWRGHLQAVADGANTQLAVAIRQYGKKRFSIKSLAVAVSRAELNRLEAKWIKKLSTIWPNGYNSTGGGSGNVKGVQVKYRGVVYGSHTQLAGTFGIDAETLRMRLKRGVNLRTAVEQANLQHDECQVDGVTFRSRKAAAEHFGLDHRRVHARLSQGWTIKEALGIDIRKPSKTAPKVVRINSLTFDSRIDAARHFGIEYGAFCRRLKKGWSLKEALNLSPRKKKTDFYNSHQVSVAGREYKSLSAAARTFKVPLSRVMGRLRQGWSLDDAFLKPHRDAGKSS